MPRRRDSKGHFLPGKSRKARKSRKAGKRSRALARPPTSAMTGGRSKLSGAAIAKQVSSGLVLHHPGSGASIEKRVEALESNQHVLARGIVRVSYYVGSALQAAYGRKSRRRRAA